MSSQTNNTNETAAKDEKVYEITAIVFASVMTFVSLLVIIMNVRLSHRINSRRKHPSMKKVRKMLVKGRAAVKSGHLTAQETVILALEAGMTMEDVRLEYVNSTGTREEILEGVFGKSPSDQIMFIKMKAGGRFMESGYANEKVFLDLWKSESYRELVMTQQREECRTQSYIAPTEEHPPSIAEVPKNRSPTQGKPKMEKSGGSGGMTKSGRKKKLDIKMLSCLPESKPLMCRNSDDV